MEQKQLGSTGLMVPEIGFGTWRYQGEPAVVHRALELGSFLIDTAENYRTEEAVGRAVRGHRGDFFLATKVSPGNLHHDDLLRAAENSLRRLGSEWIDLYQVHWPNPRIPISETMRAMTELVAAGKVRYVGVSNFSVREFQEAQDALGDVPLVCNQVEYNLFNREIEDELLPYCAANGVSVMAYSPLAQGRLDQQLRSRPKLASVLDEVCRTTGMTRAQVLLAWCVRHPQVITIPQTNRVERVAENCSASGGRLTAEQFSALSIA
jgi:diketogulonate reductase-like aldo/keto reductase